MQNLLHGCQPEVRERRKVITSKPAFQFFVRKVIIGYL
jgi:hypothetical protein